MTDSSISTIIPTYNRANLLGRAIKSVISQLEEGDELIVVDDGSTDETESVVAQFGDRIRYIKKSHGGAGTARNLGVKEARNPLVAFLDSDDEWMPGKIKLQRHFMEVRQDVLFSFTNIAFRRKDGNKVRFSLRTWPGVSQSWEDIFGPGKPVSSLMSLPNGTEDFQYYVGDLYHALLTGCYVTAITLIVRREEAGDALHYAEDTKTYEDWECFARLACAGKCAYLDCETALNHSHINPRLTDFGGFERAEALVAIIERVWGFDKDFLVKHGEFYGKVLNEHRLSKVNGLLIRGRTKHAREELKKLPGSLWVHRVLAMMPGTITKLMVRGFLILRRASAYIISVIRDPDS